VGVFLLSSSRPQASRASRTHNRRQRRPLPALSEMHYGSLVGVKNAPIVMLGTGISGTIMAHGNLLDGARHCAAELSFIRVGGRCRAA